MPHLIKLHVPYIARNFWFRQALAKRSYPAVYERMVYPQNAPQHPKRAFGHGIKQNAQRFLCSDFIVSAIIAFSEIASALFAVVSLFIGDYSALDHTIRSAFLACWHSIPASQSFGNIIPLIYNLVNTLKLHCICLRIRQALR